MFGLQLSKFLFYPERVMHVLKIIFVTAIINTTSSLSVLHAQNHEMDSLRKQLPFLKDTIRIDYLNAISFQYIRLLKRDSAEYFERLAYAESKKLNYINGIAKSISNQSGVFNFFDNDFIKAESLARKSIEWFEKIPDKRGMENAIDNLWFALFSQSKYDEAYRISATKYQKSKVDNDLDGLHDALDEMEVIHYQEGDYDSSFYYYRQVQQMSIGSKNNVWISNSLLDLAILYRSIGDYQTALNNYRTIFLTDTHETVQARVDGYFEVWTKMEYAELFSLVNQFDSAWHYYHLFDTIKATEKDLRIYLVSTGETYLLQKEYNKALPNFLRGLIMHRKLNDRNEIKRTLLDIAKTYFAMNNDKAALHYAAEGLDLSLQTKSRQFIRDAYQILYSVYDRLHKTDSAYSYYKKYIAFKDIVVTDQTKGRFAAYLYERQINLMNNEKIINQQELRIQQQQLHQAAFQKKILIAGIIGLFFLAGIIMRTIVLKRKNERHLREIAENELRLQKIVSEKEKAELQQQAIELEMQALRSQMNPHFIFNSLNSINRFILQNNKVKASEYLTKFSRLVRMILQNSQAALITLESELESLRLYLEMEALRFNYQFDYKISVSNELDIDVLKVPPLIIQPYAENAIWHGLMHKEEKGQLDIEISEEDNKLLCKITDNGIGRALAGSFASKSATVHKSMGMRITASRIAMMQNTKENKAAITIHDLINSDGSAAGTEVIISMPVLYE